MTEPSSYLPAHAKSQIDKTYFNQGKQIGEDDFGMIYKGQYLYEKVRVKAQFCFKEETVMLFEQELDHLVSLRHANIVQLRGSFIEGREYKIVTENVKGIPLSRLLVNSGELSNAARYRIAKEAGSGLAYLHFCRVVHGDISSEMIMVDKRMHVKIADIGLSCFKRENLNYKYMAPESIAEKEPKKTKEGDVYSFGVLLRELWTGEEPMKGMKFHTIAKTLLEGPEEREPLEPLTPSVIADLVRRCWKKSPEERPSMHQVVEHLVKNLEGEKGGVEEHGEKELPPSKEIMPSVAPTVPKEESKSYNPIGAFGAEEWLRYFGIEIKDAPALPEDIEIILKSRCSFLTDKNVEETHKLILIPKTFNIRGETWNLERFNNFLKERKYEKGEFKGISYDRDSTPWFETPQKSKWILIAKEPFPQEWRKKRRYQEHFKVLGYHKISAYEALMSFLATWAQNDPPLFENKERDSVETTTQCGPSSAVNIRMLDNRVSFGHHGLSSTKYEYSNLKHLLLVGVRDL